LLPAAGSLVPASGSSRALSALSAVPAARAARPTGGSDATKCRRRRTSRVTSPARRRGRTRIATRLTRNSEAPMTKPAKTSKSKTLPGPGSFVPAEFDQARAEKAVRELLYAIGEDPDRQGLVDTPARVARAYQEMFAGLYANPDDVLNTTFDEQHDELV